MYLAKSEHILLKAMTDEADNIGMEYAKRLAKAIFPKKLEGQILCAATAGGKPPPAKKGKEKKNEMENLIRRVMAGEIPPPSNADHPYLNNQHHALMDKVARKLQIYHYDATAAVGTSEVLAAWKSILKKTMYADSVRKHQGFMAGQTNLMYCNRCKKLDAAGIHLRVVAVVRFDKVSLGEEQVQPTVTVTHVFPHARECLDHDHYRLWRQIDIEFQGSGIFTITNFPTAEILGDAYANMVEKINSIDRDDADHPGTKIQNATETSPTCETDDRFYVKLDHPAPEQKAFFNMVGNFDEANAEAQLRVLLFVGNYLRESHSRRIHDRVFLPLTSCINDRHRHT